MKILHNEDQYLYPVFICKQIFALTKALVQHPKTCNENSFNVLLKNCFCHCTVYYYFLSNNYATS